VKNEKRKIRSYGGVIKKERKYEKNVVYNKK
jgi:hypothetical protein